MKYYSIQSSKDVIQHFGIKGMKWGFQKRHSKKSRKKYADNDNSYDARMYRVREKERKDKIGLSKSNREKYDSLTKQIWKADHDNRPKDFDRLWSERAKLVKKRDQ